MKYTDLHPVSIIRFFSFVLLLGPSFLIGSIDQLLVIEIFGEGYHSFTFVGFLALLFASLFYVPFISILIFLILAIVFFHLNSDIEVGYRVAIFNYSFLLLFFSRRALDLIYFPHVARFILIFCGAEYLFWSVFVPLLGQLVPVVLSLKSAYAFQGWWFGPFVRVTSSLGPANVVGMIMIISFVVYQFTRPRLAFFFLIVSLFTFSKGPYLVIVANFIYYHSVYIGRTMTIKKFFKVIFVLFFLLPLFFAIVVAKLLSPENAVSLVRRVEKYELYADIFLDRFDFFSLSNFWGYGDIGLLEYRGVEKFFNINILSGSNNFEKLAGLENSLIITYLEAGILGCIFLIAPIFWRLISTCNLVRVNCFILSISFFIWLVLDSTLLNSQYSIWLLVFIMIARSESTYKRGLICAVK